MAFAIDDRVWETSTTTGTGTYTLAGASAGAQSFATVGDGNTTYYVATDGTDWEVGVGTYTAAGTTLARTTIIRSSNGDAAVSWGAGTKQVFGDIPADKRVIVDDSGNLVLGDGTAFSITESQVSDLGSYSTVGHTHTEADITDLGTLTAMVADHLGVFAATTSAQLAGVISDETGSGALVFATSPALVTPAIGTPSSGVLTNCTGYPGDASLTTVGTISSGTWNGTAIEGTAIASTGEAGGTKFLREDGDGTCSWQTVAAGGLTDWTENNGTYSSQDWVQFTPASGTNVHSVITPLGTGAIQAHVADGTSTGGNNRGTYAVDLQLARSAATQVSSGNYSVLFGRFNTASASYAVCAGLQSTASGTAAFAMGNNCTASGDRSVALVRAATASGNESAAIGYNCTSSGENSIATGLESTTRSIRGAASHASGNFSAQGDAQRESFVLRCDTTDATQTALTADNAAAGTSNIPVLPNNHAYGFVARVTARDSSGNVAKYRVEGLIKRGASAATTTLSWSSVTTDYEDTAGWDVDAAADTTNGGLLIRATGAAATNINWVSRVETEEVG